VSLIRSRSKTDPFEHLWLITFADLMVQVMAFFALTYSFDLQDQSRTNQMLESLRRALGVEQGQSHSTGQGILPGQAGLAPERAADLEKLMSDLRSAEGPDQGQRMRLVSFRGSILYGEGSTALDPTFQRLLERIAGLVQEYPGFQLVCEGHAAPGERGRGGVDALELSGQRAQAAVRILVSRGVNGAALAAEAHGDSQVDGDPSSQEGRALQRRVAFRFQRVAER
jgi:flagellar motor protein MotB